MTLLSFDNLVGDRQIFESKHFDRCAMYRRSGLEISPTDLLTIEDLDHLVHLEVVRPPYVSIYIDGILVPPTAYTKNVRIQGTMITDVVDPERVYGLYQMGGTIKWASLNHVMPSMRDFTRMISDAMAVRTDAMAFLTPPRKQSYPPHHDPVDLFIVQLHGSKQWSVWDDADRRGAESGRHSELSLGEPSMYELLEPGDILYLPYGTPHAATAGDEPSLHLSVMMRPRRWSRLLAETVERILDDPEFDEYPYLGASFGESVEVSFSSKMTLLEERLRNVDLSAEWEWLKARGQHLPGASTGSLFAQGAQDSGT